MLRPQPVGSTIGGHGSTAYAMVTDILAAGNLPYTTDDYAATPEDYSPDVLDAAGNPVEITMYGGYGPDRVVPKYSQQISQWCSSCHSRYHATKTGSSAPGSTNSGDAIFAYQHKTGDEVISRRVIVDDLPVLEQTDGYPVLIGPSLPKTYPPAAITDPADLTPLYLDAGSTTPALAEDGEQAYFVSYETPEDNEAHWVLDENGDPIPVYVNGVLDGKLLEQDYEHEPYAYSCGYDGANCHGGTRNFNKMLNCLGCHVSHGTSATMTPYAQIPWPGEDATTDDGLYSPVVDTTAMANWTGVSNPLNGQYTDGDWDTRSSLLRLNNRGVCQNAYCHPKGNDNMHLGPDGFEQGSDFDYGGSGGH